ncbi:MAG: T9SS type A sorting domain-containing protein [Bacteroidia bacterium]|nr:T9SS type A sorting domain-containing protein [Bacteroidia bacterium]
MKTTTTILFFVLAPLAVLCQWSNNPSLNTKIIDTVGYQVLPKVAVNTNGESYISWFSQQDTISYFEIYLQRLDADGNKLWNDDGLLVSNHPTWTWVTDYDLTVDTDGFAIVVTQDARTGFSDVFAYRISPDGTFEWGPDGIALTNDDNFDPSPQVVVTTDDNIVFMWAAEPADTNEFTQINLQKLSMDGQQLWAGNTVISHDTMHCWMPHIIATEDTGVLVVWVETHSTDTSAVGNWPNMYPMAQKIDGNGNEQWPEPAAIDTLNNMPLFTFEVSLVSDGNNGFFIGWMAFPAGPSYNSYIQHVNSEGIPQWTANGVPVSDSVQYQHYDPSLTYLPQDEELFVFWNVLNKFIWTEAIYGQKYTMDGQNQWTDGGKIFIGWYSYQDTLIGLSGIKKTSEDDFTMFFENEFISIIGTDTILANNYIAQRLDRNGNSVWEDNKLVFANSASSKGRITLSELVNEQWIAVWQDCRKNPTEMDLTGIYAQNIWTSGNLGPLGVQDYVHSNNFLISTYPNPFNTTLTVEYRLEQKADVDVSLYDLYGRMIKYLFSAQQQPGDHCYKLEASELPDGVYIIKLRQNGNLAYSKIVKSK